MLSVGDVVMNRFCIEALAGEGGTSTVYRAKDRDRGDDVALKVLKPGASTTTDEASLLLELVHPSIVRCIAFGRIDADQPWLAVEWLEGTTLRDRLAQGPRLEVHEALAVTRQVAEALGAAHAWGVVHRDVTPANILLVGGDIARVKVLDFGIALQGRRDGTTAGTIGYLSPEQARADAVVDARSDVFALGCVLYEALTGERPFSAEHDVAILARVLFDDVPAPSTLRKGVSASLDGLVSRMLLKDPQGRPRDGTQVAAQLAILERKLTGGSTSSRASGMIAALTTVEQRSITLVFAQVSVSNDQRSRINGTLTEMGVRPDWLDLNTLCASIGDESQSAVERGVRAVRLALALRRSAPDAPISVVTARVAGGERWAGPAIDRALTMLRAGAIVADDATARVVAERFEIVPTGNVFEVRAERVTGGTRTLLGKEVPTLGREREVSVITGTLEECFDEPASRVVLLTGAPGIGKTRVRDEVVAAVRARSATVLSARSDPTKQEVPFGVLAQLVREAAAVSETSARELVRSSVLSRFVGPRVEFLLELLGSSTEQDMTAALQAARHDTMLMRDQLSRVWIDLVDNELKAGPLAIVIDDAQWCDAQSIKALDRAMHNASERPLFLLVAGRPEARETVFKLLAGRQPLSLSLGKLGAKGIEKMVRIALPSATDAVVKSIVERAAGNPFFAEELVRAHAARGERPVAGIPETVLAMLEARLSNLEPEARRVMRAGSVFGQSFPIAGVAALLDEESDYTEAWASWLSEREVLAPLRTGMYSFRHALLQETAYAMLTDEDRRLGHELAAEHLEAQGPSDPVVIAQHFELAGMAPIAATHYARATTQALERGDLDAAIAIAGRARPGLSGEPLAELEAVVAEVLRWRGDYEGARRAALFAFANARRGSTAHLRACAEAAVAVITLGRTEELEPIQQSLLSVDAPDDRDAASIACSRVTLQLLVRGDMTGAEALLTRAERFAEGDLARARLTQARATRASFAGDISSYAELSGECALLFAKVGDVRNECTQKVTIAALLCELGRADLARDWIVRALQTADEQRLLTTSAAAKHVMGIVLARERSLEEALTMQKRAAAELDALGNVRLRAGAECHVSLLCTALGRHDEALTIAQRAERALVVSPPARPFALAALARALLAQGRVQEAVAASREAQTLVAAHASIDSGESLVALVHAEALRAARDPGLGAHLDAARARIAERAALITDPMMRESFLRLPENARLTAVDTAENPH